MEVCWPETATSFKRPLGLQLTVPDDGYYDSYYAGATPGSRGSGARSLGCTPESFATSCQGGKDSTPINQSVEIFLQSCSSSRVGAARRLSPLGWSALGRDAVCEELNLDAPGGRQAVDRLPGAAAVTRLGGAGPSTGHMPVLAPGEETQRGQRSRRRRRRRRSASWAELPSTNPLWEQQGGASGHELQAPSCQDQGHQDMEGLAQLARSPVARPKRGGGGCPTYYWDFSGFTAASCSEGGHGILPAHTQHAQWEGVQGEGEEEPAGPEGLCRSPVARPRRTQQLFGRGSVAAEALGLHASTYHEALLNSDTDTQMIEGPPISPKTGTEQNMTDSRDTAPEPGKKPTAPRVPRRATWRRHSISGGPETATCLLPSCAGLGSGGALRPCIRSSSGASSAPARGNRSTPKRVSFEENILRTVLIKRMEERSPSGTSS